MLSGGRLTVGTIVVFAAIALAELTSRIGGAALSAPVAVRLALGTCATAFFLVTALYYDSGYTDQAIGHGTAGVGLTTVAIGSEGLVAWVGILLLATGGTILVQSSHHGSHGPAST